MLDWSEVKIDVIDIVINVFIRLYGIDLRNIILYNDNLNHKELI